ncbi:MAG: hypothetical protein ACJ0QD_04400 [Flavobacteriaceae bacterium]
MKKHIKATLLLFTTLLLISCSSDDDTGNNDDTNGTNNENVFVKRITEDFVSNDNSDIYVTDYTYDGNKIATKKEYINGKLNYSYKFNYTGNHITSIEFTTIDLTGADAFTNYLSYDNDLIIGENDIAFEYNGNVVKIEFNYSSTLPSNCIELTLKNNQPILETYYDDCQTITYREEIKYDTNKGMFSNILGHNWWFIFDCTFCSAFGIGSGLNNIVSWDEDETYEYEYNENGYPISFKVKEYVELKLIATIEYY